MSESMIGQRRIDPSNGRAYTAVAYDESSDRIQLDTYQWVAASDFSKAPIATADDEERPVGSPKKPLDPLRTEFPIKNPTPAEIDLCGKLHGVAIIKVDDDGEFVLVDPSEVEGVG